MEVDDIMIHEELSRETTSEIGFCFNGYVLYSQMFNTLEVDLKASTTCVRGCMNTMESCILKMCTMNGSI
jgi:hypothetical protein